MISKLGWCITGHHKTCPAKRFKILGSDGKSRPVQTNEVIECPCDCHERSVTVNRRQ